MIIIQVSNKVLMGFCSRKEILLDTNTFSISTSFLKNRTFIVVNFFFSISILPNVKFYLPIFIFYKFLCFTMLRFFRYSTFFGIFHYVCDITFDNFVNNTAVIITFNV